MWPYYRLQHPTPLAQGSTSIHERHSRSIIVVPSVFRHSRSTPVGAHSLHPFLGVSISCVVLGLSRPHYRLTTMNQLIMDTEDSSHVGLAMWSDGQERPRPGPRSLAVSPGPGHGLKNMVKLVPGPSEAQQPWCLRRPEVEENVVWHCTAATGGRGRGMVRGVAVVRHL